MKRDMDLIRDILKMMEANDDPQGIGQIDIEGQDPRLVNYHIGLLADANFIEAFDISSTSGPKVWPPEQITWNGHVPLRKLCCSCFHFTVPFVAGFGQPVPVANHCCPGPWEISEVNIEKSLACDHNLTDFIIRLPFLLSTLSAFYFLLRSNL